MSEKRSRGAPASATGTKVDNSRGGFGALGAREQTAARVIRSGSTPAPGEMVLRSFRPLPKGKPRGFAAVELTCGVLVDVPVFVGQWAALPRKAAVIELVEARHPGALKDGCAS